MEVTFKDLDKVDICKEKNIKGLEELELNVIDSDKVYLLSDMNTKKEKLDSKKETKNNKKESQNSSKKSTTSKKNNYTGTGVIQTAPVETNNKFINAVQHVVDEQRKKEIAEISKVPVDFPYKRVNVLTDAELQLFNFMKNNLCQVDRIEILPKVRLADVATLDTRITTDKSYLWKVTNKHIDFLICKADTLDIICAVELDDYTHETPEAKEKDMFIMQVLDTVGIKTVRIRTRIRAIERSDLSLIDDYINIALAPKCPYCGKQMYPKQSRVGHRFYACEDFINCRNTIDIDPRGAKLP